MGTFALGQQLVGGVLSSDSRELFLEPKRGLVHSRIVHEQLLIKVGHRENIRVVTRDQFATSDFWV